MQRHTQNTQSQQLTQKSEPTGSKPTIILHRFIKAESTLKGIERLQMFRRGEKRTESITADVGHPRLKRGGSSWWRESMQTGTATAEKRQLTARREAGRCADEPRSRLPWYGPLKHSAVFCKPLPGRQDLSPPPSSNPLLHSSEGKWEGDLDTRPDGSIQAFCRAGAKLTWK